MPESKTTWDDIKNIKNYILGVAAFASALSATLIEVFHFRTEPTIVTIAGIAILTLITGLLVERSNRRQAEALNVHIADSKALIAEMKSGMDYLKDMALENQRSSIRLEMNSLIRNNPENHDTILAYGEKYFLELNGDWKETDIFLSWVDEEAERGRKVHIPSNLLVNVQTKKELER